jgi:hypothetical protein
MGTFEAERRVDANQRAPTLARWCWG